MTARDEAAPVGLAATTSATVGPRLWATGISLSGRYCGKTRPFLLTTNSPVGTSAGTEGAFPMAVGPLLGPDDGAEAGLTFAPCDGEAIFSFLPPNEGRVGFLTQAAIARSKRPLPATIRLLELAQAPSESIPT